MRLSGKVVLVTAAGQGIGRASALAVAREGATVLATDVRAEALRGFDGVRNISTAPLDVLEPAQIEAVIGGLACINVLFNCAGYVHSGTVLESSDADFDLAVSLNVRSQFWTIRAALPRMLENGSGS